MAASEKKIAETLAVLKANGGDASLTARQTGVPRKTITYWRDKKATNERDVAISDKTQEEEEDLGNMLESFIRRVFNVGLTDDKLKEAPIEKLVLAAAVAVDKMQLLRGHPTDINEQRGLSVLQQFNQQISGNGYNGNGKHEG